jgi:hypothetical protein
MLIPVSFFSIRNSCTTSISLDFASTLANGLAVPLWLGWAYRAGSSTPSLTLATKVRQASLDRQGP